MKPVFSFLFCCLLFCATASTAQDTPSLEQQLLTALVKKQSDTAVSLIEQGAKVNMVTGKDLPFLNIASYNVLNEVVKSMIAKGVNSHARDPKGATGLILAASKGHLAVVQSLIDPNLGVQVTLVKDGPVRVERKPDVNAQDLNGFSALMAAVKGNHYKAINELIFRGADLHLKTKSGSTALMMAAAQGDRGIVEYLLLKGASKELRSQAGDTALSIAKSQNNSDIISLLTNNPSTANGTQSGSVKREPSVSGICLRHLSQRTPIACERHKS